VALVRFGTTANQVIDLILDGEVTRGILRSAVQQLRTTDQWTHFDELVNHLVRIVPEFSTTRVSGLVYSDGECSPDPTSGKRCIDPQSLGTLVPFSVFNMYLVRITATPQAVPQAPAVTNEVPSIQIVESKQKQLNDVSQQILRRIQTPLPRLELAKAPLAPPRLEDSLESGHGANKVMLTLAGLAAAGLFGVLYWTQRFRPFLLQCRLTAKPLTYRLTSCPRLSASDRRGPATASRLVLRRPFPSWSRAGRCMWRCPHRGRSYAVSNMQCPGRMTGRPRTTTWRWAPSSSSSPPALNIGCSGQTCATNRDPRG
jgi:hypothetical protein